MGELILLHRTAFAIPVADAFLDSSILIGLVFRHAGERAACRKALPSDGHAFCSRYVVFEVARGFLRSLIALHNYSYEFNTFADIHQAAYSGQQRFKPYAMHTWLGAFSDYFAALEAEDGACGERLTLEEFRAKLRGWIRRGWRQIGQDYKPLNEIGCREDLLPPTSRGDRRIDQHLPDDECGQPKACRLQSFIRTWKTQVEAVSAGLNALPVSRKDKETLSRIDSLRHLLEAAPGGDFEGKKCHRCGDALICLEAPPDHIIVTKNRKHFETLAQILGKPLTVAETARVTA